METTSKEATTTKQPIISRFFYTVLFLIIGHFISMVVFFTTVLQFIYTAVTGKNQERILVFTADLANYAKDVIDYLTYNSEEKPWPMGEWNKK